MSSNCLASESVRGGVWPDKKILLSGAEQPGWAIGWRTQRAAAVIVLSEHYLVFNDASAPRKCVTEGAGFEEAEEEAHGSSLNSGDSIDTVVQRGVHHVNVTDLGPEYQMIGTG